MGVFNLIIYYRTPIIVKNVVSKRTNVIVRLLLPRLSDHTIGSSGINAFLKVPQTGIIPLCIAIRFERLFKD